MSTVEANSSILGESMTKDVLVSISGMQMDILDRNLESEPIEVVTAGNYYLRNGKHYVLYDEVMEGVTGTIKNQIKITGTDTLEIIKTGITNSHMIFEKNKTNQTYYKTPMGQMLVGIHTRNLDVSVFENHIDVKVDYELDVNHEPLADCKIRMNIMTKQGGKLDLRSHMPS